MAKKFRVDCLICGCNLLAAKPASDIETVCQKCKSVIRIVVSEESVQTIILKYGKDVKFETDSLPSKAI